MTANGRASGGPTEARNVCRGAMHADSHSSHLLSNSGLSSDTRAMTLIRRVLLSADADHQS